MDQTKSYELNESVGVKGFAYVVDGIYHPPGYTIVRLKKLAGEKTLWLTEGRLYEMSIRDEVTRFRRLPRMPIRRYRRNSRSAEAKAVH